ncbi:MAG: putative membrane protein [Bradymonadia bacterium]|jgi:putative membrane protein
MLLVGPMAWASVILVAYYALGWHAIALPTLPLSILGTAVSFYLGFKGNSAYGRLWEARKIWGGIVNTSRTWGVLTRDFIAADSADTAPGIHRELVNRHIAWLAALRTLLRRRKPWEMSTRVAEKIRRQAGTADMSTPVLEARMQPYLAPDELAWVMARKNAATQLLAKQSERVAAMHAADRIDDFRHVEIARLIETLYTLQGQCERIKNFPLPRQYVSVNGWFVLLFVTAVPFGILPLFTTGARAAWIGVPISAVLSWVFLVWNRVTDWSENPFEGLVNDIPIDALSRTIEIDLLETLGEIDLPEPLSVRNDTQF